uniref:Solute carrier family 23 member 3 n=1 Tax=Chrysemys picta bellii TaxID=8478 RepID=A0A8C3HGV8_CHRPI
MAARSYLSVLPFQVQTCLLSALSRTVPPLGAGISHSERLVPLLSQPWGACGEWGVCAGVGSGRPWGRHHCLLIPCSPQVSGAVVVSGLVQLALGVSGVGGWVAQRCGPMVLAPSLSIIGLSAYKEAAHFCSASWGVALLVLLAILFSQHLGSCRLPLCTWTRAKGISVETSIPALRMFSVRGPVLRAALSFPTGPGQPAWLTTANGTLRSPWLQVPYPGEGEWPSLSSRALGVGVAMGITSSMNSVGCYLLCPRALRTPALPRHACNRGLCTEGLGSLLLGALGGVSGTASSIPNACTNRSCSQESCGPLLWTHPKG